MPRLAVTGIGRLLARALAAALLAPVQPHYADHQHEQHEQKPHHYYHVPPLPAATVSPRVPVWSVVLESVLSVSLGNLRKRFYCLSPGYIPPITKLYVRIRLITVTATSVLHVRQVCNTRIMTITGKMLATLTTRPVLPILFY